MSEASCFCLKPEKPALGLARSSSRCFSEGFVHQSYWSSDCVVSHFSPSPFLVGTVSLFNTMWSTF